ncbi:MAG TPA: hypothetical protein VEW48_11060 [Thermoanaerobaculia bacterium]|nr:hypothetical protein [Thermoanaerobaculia bacterium]
MVSPVPLRGERGPFSYDWLHFVSRSGDEGRRWAEQYRQPEILEIDRLSTRAVLALRTRRLEQGQALLRAVEERLPGTEAPPSVLQVLNRWYYGAVAYEQYCRDDFERASESLDLADLALTAAISFQPMLLPLANHCQEFRLHQARISRNLRRWREMRSSIEVARKMTDSRAPLCMLHDGTAIHIADLCVFLLALELNDREREALAGVLDPTLRLDLFERFVADLQAIPGFVIPYRPS